MSAEEPTIPKDFEGRDVGQLAEDLLRTWISRETAITLNPAVNDKEGWDCLLEFPFQKPEQGKPWDTAGPRIQCFVQVKGTDVGARARNVKLDNWQKLIYTPQPAFFLICEFDDRTLQQSYLVHVHEDWMEKVLRRLRQSRQGEGRPLHKQNVTLTWSDEDKIEPSNGKGLVAVILEHVGHDFDEYVREKQKLRHELGLDVPFLVHITSQPYTSTDEMYSELVDFAIGLRPELPLGKLTIEENVRFGEPAGIIERDEGTLRIEPTGIPVNISFRDTLGSRQTEFSGNIYTPNYFFPDTGLPVQHRRYRIEYELGEIIWAPNEGPSTEITLDLNPPEGPVEIRRLVNTWRLITMLHESSREGLEVEISTQDDTRVKIGSINTSSVPEPHLTVAEAVENAWYLVRHLDLPIDLKVTLANIIDQRQHLKVARALLDVNELSIKAMSGPLIEQPEEPDKEHAIVLYGRSRLGDMRIFVTAGMAGPFRVSEDGAAFEISNPRRVHVEHYLLLEWANAADAINSVYDRLRKKGYEVLEYDAFRLKEEE